MTRGKDIDFLVIQTLFLHGAVHLQAASSEPTLWSEVISVDKQCFPHVFNRPVILQAARAVLAIGHDGHCPPEHDLLELEGLEQLLQHGRGLVVAALGVQLGVGGRPHAS